MPDFEEIVIFLLIFGFIAFKIIDLHDRKRKEEERKKREIEFKKNNAELSEIRGKEMCKEMPFHMKEALAEFVRDYHANGVFKWNEFSPLVCFGYRVGKAHGRPERIRREIIYYTWYADIPDIIPQHYAIQWGAPGTYKRFVKITNHLRMLGRQRQSRKNFEIAVSQWFSDADWFEKNHSNLARRYRLFGFEN